MRSFPWWRYGVEYVILYSSALRDPQHAHDLDLAIEFQHYDFEQYCVLLGDLAKYLGVREDHIDIVVLNQWEEYPAVLILEIYTSGEVLYCRDREKYLRDYVYRVGVSLDFLRDAQKLKLTERALEAARRILSEAL